MIKYLNVAIFLVLLICTLLLKDSIHFSTNLLSLFASKETLAQFQIANNLGYSKEMFIVVKGLDFKAKGQTEKISNEVETLPYIKAVQSSIIPTQKMRNYYKNYYALISDFNATSMTKEQVFSQLQDLYNRQLNSIFYTTIDTNDPLKLFHLKYNKLNIAHKGKLLTLGKYGYLVRVITDVAPAEVDKAKKLYKNVHQMLKKYNNVTVFAPFFYTVENSEKIQANVQWIVLLSTIVLLFIYYLLIKNLKLLLQTMIALASSMLFAILICGIFIENFNILSLAFGMSLTAVSIDYLLHYYFHGFYASSKKIDINVLYGFLTTVIAFAIFSFIPIPLIAQISFFAVLSLSFAYLLFTFVFPFFSLSVFNDITVEDKKLYKNRDIGRFKISASTIFVLSTILLLYSSLYFTFDNNMKHLDYQNSKLNKIQKFLKDNSPSKLQPVIVQARSTEKLVEELHEIHKLLPNTFSLASFVLDNQSCLIRKKELHKYDFKRLNTIINEEANSIGFRKNYFNTAYEFTINLPPCTVDNLNIFQLYGLPVYATKNHFYTIAYVSNLKALEGLAYIINIDAKGVLQKTVYKMTKKLMEYGIIVLILIAILLIFSVKRNFINAMNYILFPIAFTLSIIVTLGSVNIMHLFALIILIAIGIDYGIYMSNTSKQTQTILAIKYSLLSTFAAFGVLVFSSIVALHSIGMVITLGCGAIFILIKVMK